MKFSTNDRVIANGSKGTVKFVGETSFAPGIWVGIELDYPLGKNDGSVNEIRYFSCESNYGIFIRPSQIRHEFNLGTSSKNSSNTSSPQNRIRRPESPSKLNSLTRLSPTSKSQDLHRNSRDSLKDSKKTGIFNVMDLDSVSSSRQTSKSLDQLTSTDDKKSLIQEIVKLKEENDLLNISRERTSQKLQELREEMKELTKSIKENQVEKEKLQRTNHEMSENFEMLALDKEMAEEKCESMTNEITMLKEKIEQLNIEVEVLRTEKELKYLDDGTGDDSQTNKISSVEFTQLTLQNDRLKEALMKLRDVSQEQEMELKSQIMKLEKDLNEFNSLKVQHQKSLSDLALAEDCAYELKTQLDDSIGMSSMVEKLSEKNINLMEKIEEMKTTIEELESLRKLNDELEESHIETEKSLRNEMETKEKIIANQHEKILKIKNALEENEKIINNYRTLVQNLQNENQKLNEMKTQTVDHSKTALQVQELENLNLYIRRLEDQKLDNLVKLEIQKLEFQEKSFSLDFLKKFIPAIILEKEFVSFNLFRAFMIIRGKSKIAVEYLLNQISDTKLYYSVKESLINLISLCDKIMKFVELHYSEEQYKYTFPDYHQFEFLSVDLDQIFTKLQQGVISENELNDFKKQLDKLDLISRKIDEIFGTLIEAGNLIIEKSIINLETASSCFMGDEGEQNNKNYSQIISLLEKSQAKSRKIKILLESFKNNGDIFCSSKLMLVLNGSYQSSLSIRNLMFNIFNATANLNEFEKSLEQITEQLLLFISESEKNVELITKKPAEYFSKGTQPKTIWETSIFHFRTQINKIDELENKKRSLNDQIKKLLAENRNKDQILDETKAKIDILIKRNEQNQKQNDNNEIEELKIKNQLQEKQYQETLENLHAEITKLESENSQIKRLLNNQEKMKSVNRSISQLQTRNSSANIDDEQMEQIKKHIKYLRNENRRLRILLNQNIYKSSLEIFDKNDPIIMKSDNFTLSSKENVSKSTYQSQIEFAFNSSIITLQNMYEKDGNGNYFKKKWFPKNQDPFFKSQKFVKKLFDSNSNYIIATK